MVTTVISPEQPATAPGAARYAPADSTDPDSIWILDEWNGLSPAAPIRAYYRLQRDQGEFSGFAMLSVGARRGSPFRRLRVSVPVSIVREFAEMLARAPRVRGRYEPRITHTDDYPHIRMIVRTPGAYSDWFTRSQGRHHVPWGLRVDRVMEYVVPSADPHRALELLKPDLRYDILEKMVASVRRGRPAR